MDTSYFSLAKGGYLPLGFFKIDFFAIDVSGNSDTCSFFIDIQDTTAPAFVGTLSDTTLYTTQDSCSVYYAWTQPTIEENSDQLHLDFKRNGTERKLRYRHTHLYTIP